MQMAGKKKEKFRITMLFTCNADGSECLLPMYIGKAKKPHCFKKQSPTEHGFYYQNNKKAWMTSELFEEQENYSLPVSEADLIFRYIKDFNIKMHNQNCHICLMLDNFLGHSIQYQPQNICLLYFEPNLTSFIQLLNAGIIRCFKAHYHHEFCLHTIERDDAGEHNIYKINLMEGMLMAHTAWGQVKALTIKNCWDHGKILGFMP